MGRLVLLPTEIFWQQSPSPVQPQSRGTTPWYLPAAQPRGELTLSKSYSSGNRKGFLSGLLNKIKEELAKNKEMKESIKKFRNKAKNLEESDVFQEARRK